MKHGKNPTVAQRKLIESAKLLSSKWLVVKHTSRELVIVNRASGRERKIAL